MATTYKSQAARDAQRMQYGDPSYWAYLDAHAEELRASFLRKGQPSKAREMMTRTISEALKGNDGI